MERLIDIVVGLGALKRDQETFLELFRPILGKQNRQLCQLSGYY